MEFQKTLISLFVMGALSACGNSSDNNSSDDDTGGGGETVNSITATFVDSAIAGLEYQCDTSQGVTNSAGEFTIVEGESCSFSINGFDIGRTDNISATNLIVTPYDTAENAEYAVKIAAILQTIDADGDPSNGIDIGSFNKQIPTGILQLENEEKFIYRICNLTNTVIYRNYKGCI